MKEFGEDYAELTVPYENLAEIYEAQGQYKHALDYYNRAYKVALMKKGLDHPDTAKLTKDLSRLQGLMTVDGELRKSN